MKRNTIVTIQGDRFMINGELTYKGRRWKGHQIEGLLMNSRMVQGTFDDRNPETVDHWAYPDTGKWDADRNTREFIEQMPVWKSHGLLAITLNLQGGSPEGYSKHFPWSNSAFHPDGSLDPKYMSRLEQILDKADELGMVVILGLFYFGEDMYFTGERAVKQAVANSTAWLLSKGYTNVIIEIANECNVRYKEKILMPARIHELIEAVQVMSKAIRPELPLLTSASFGGGSVPSDNVLEVSDFVLIHGNGNTLPWISQHISRLKNREAYKGQPIVNNEDDHYNFEKEVNHFTLTVQHGVSWGYLDLGESNYKDGYQQPPVNWGLSSARKQAFFKLLKEITGD